MDRRQRFEAFVDELKEAAPANTLEEARMLLETVLNAVEDRYSGADFDPSNWRTDGRLYPPQDDREILTDREDVRIFKTVGHIVAFGVNGAIRITRVSVDAAGRDVVLDKAGADGRQIVGR